MLAGSEPEIGQDDDVGAVDLVNAGSWFDGNWGAGAEDVSRGEAFEFTNGEPPVLLGDNEGANPVEFLLHALAGCVTTTTVLHASARGIEIESLSTRLVGDLDIQGCWRSATFRPATEISGSRWTSRQRTRATRSWTILDDLLQFARARSPVCNTVCRPVPVVVERVRR